MTSFRKLLSFDKKKISIGKSVAVCPVLVPLVLAKD